MQRGLSYPFNTSEMFVDQSSVFNAYQDQLLKYAELFNEHVSDLAKKHRYTWKTRMFICRKWPALETKIKASKTLDELVEIVKQMNDEYVSLQELLKYLAEEPHMDIVIQDWKAQFQEDYDDLKIISQGITLNLIKNNPIEPIKIQVPQPIQIVVRGESRDIPAGEYIIKGTLVSAMEDVNAFLFCR